MEIHVKGGYSDRIGKTNFQDIVQFQQLNTRTRGKLYDALLYNMESKGEFYFIRAIEYLYTEIFGVSTSKIPTSYNGGYRSTNIQEELFKIISNYPYENIFSLLEGMGLYFNSANYYKNINSIFSSENVQHRFVGNQITDITSEADVKAVVDATRSDVYGSHIDKAIKYLYDRNKPDPENSIKESVMAVESICKEITGDHKGTLGAVLKKINLHPSLRESFSKLYGYSSDVDGIRHAKPSDQTTITKEEAQFILVTCSAFCNYLKATQIP